MRLGRRNALPAVRNGLSRTMVRKVAADLETGGAANLFWGGATRFVLNAASGWRRIGVLMRLRLGDRRPIG